MVTIAYNNIISRSNVAALIPEVVSNEILGGLVNKSAALTMFRRVRMATNATRMPVLSALPTAYFVNPTDVGLKQTTEVAWANKYLNVEEIAAIVPIPESVLDDTSFDVWGEVMPLCTDAVARVLDAAVFFGTNKPSTWGGAIVTDATAAGNVVNRSLGTARADKAGLAGYISDALGQVEADGFDATGMVANTIYKGILRNTRDANGNLLAEVSPTSIYGLDVTYPMRGLWPTAGTGAAEAVLGDYSQAILGVRQDFTYKVLTEGVIQDAAGAIQYNLPQQDMVALRIVFRCAFQTANTLNYDNASGSTRYPFSVIKQAV